MRKIELLAPAKDLETGRQAILHGADAVYIGGPGFGARQAAGNSLEDIAALCEFARPYGVRIYVTLNTILYDNELREVESLTQSLYQCGVSALITQDLALLRMDCPLPLHASTQMDNRTPAKARLLERLGYEQIVLARELSLQQIRAIHEAVPDTPLEAFVHGALCVSYSGRCQASQHCFQRSANRGACAQFCRLAFELVDAEGKTLEYDRHLLSLRDMNRTASLEAMIDAGVSSFKIEGRLKDIPYVKNVTAWYRQHLDKIIARRPDLCRASEGEHTFHFQPQPERSFNRGFSEYFLHGRKGDEHNIFSPKAVGQPVGTLAAVGSDYIDINLAPGISLANGDGLCYFDEDHRLRGFRINRAAGPRAYIFSANPNAIASLTYSLNLNRGTTLYRNQDMEMDGALAHHSAERRLPLDIILTDDMLEQPYELARTPQEDNIRQQMSRLGDTPYYLRSLDIRFSQNWFIPSSHLAALRRKIVDEQAALVLAKSATKGETYQGEMKQKRMRAILEELSLNEEYGGGIEMGGGIANSMARQIASTLRLNMQDACEVTPDNGEPLMICRHCIRHTLGMCLKENPKHTGALFLRLPDGRKFPLKFDCSRCDMLVLPSC